VPYVPNAWEYGRRLDESRLRLCVDTRDGAWEVDRDIGVAIAGALLLEPVIHEVKSGPAVDVLDQLYRVMLQNCAVHLGFKLLPGAYPDWLTLTREYYRASYVFITSEPEWQALADVPRSEPIASTLGTRADYRLTSYLLALGEDERWARFPYGTPAQTLAALQDGTVKVALTWEPSLWADHRNEPGAAALHVIDPDPLPASEEAVGAVVLARETYLRARIDEAIAALVADGTIAGILAHHDFPARAAE
jgi:polar amino acid transport system substrate-binding protein